ncbi:MAG: hypothetical protein WA771_13535 [Chthoniobacterales bacterium]
MIDLILRITTGIALDQRVRRKAMFAITLAALALLFVGTTLLWSTFADHPVFFAIYWLICAWLTVSAMLLSIYDLLVVTRRHRAERRRALDELKRD